MIIFPNCKINLGLFVTEKRHDNFHNIQTVFYPVNLTDALEILPSNGRFEFNVTGIDLPNDNNNLCIKAYNILQKTYDLPPVKMHLHKKIPIGAGLGGGSSNAAFTINALNSLFELNMSIQEKEAVARSLGSDCAFFVNNKPVYATEKGDVFHNINLSLKAFYIVIVCPPIHVNTAWAYSKIKPLKTRAGLNDIIELSIEDWVFELYNDFEFPIFDIYPEIKTIKEELYNMGAVYASMSGSGASVYGLFHEHICLDNKFKNCFVWQGRCEF